MPRTQIRDGKTYQELRKRGESEEKSARSSMSKNQLIDALRKH